MNYYDILEINKNATLQDIKKSYKKLVIKYHPDKNLNKNTVNKFQQIQNAYQCLSNDKKRKEYDVSKYINNTNINFNFDINDYHNIITEICGKYELNEFEIKEIMTIFSVEKYEKDIEIGGIDFAYNKLVDKLLIYLPKFTFRKLKQYSFMTPIIDIFSEIYDL
ncbi:J domain-containing [Acanthamoeba polyphaga mimivirus]|uniref:J domain-containing n=5 Tax=Megamimivirinae TaxID=3044648 RepID=A0A2L2DIW7_MIMIV|nr:putative J domain-containing protein [Megavirus chiliensis]AFX92405.1 putative J domain-containing protein [Megavirus courdo11]AGD92271.1 putative J domain-containing protein [Megavirus lba]AUV58307.1 J domain-containing protein [Bandra megavirus]AVG46095.1 J domain-containing [Acanthamoeba polyphaga mimivirus]AEQ33006.1 DnaJ domain-containing protein [Megavirus chiliensis]